MNSKPLALPWLSLYDKLVVPDYASRHAHNKMAAEFFAHWKNRLVVNAPVEDISHFGKPLVSWEKWIKKQAALGVGNSFIYLSGPFDLFDDMWFWNYFLKVVFESNEFSMKFNILALLKIMRTLELWVTDISGFSHMLTFYHFATGRDLQALLPNLEIGYRYGPKFIYGSIFLRKSAVLEFTTIWRSSFVVPFGVNPLFAAFQNFLAMLYSYNWSLDDSAASNSYFLTPVDAVMIETDRYDETVRPAMMDAISVAFLNMLYPVMVSSEDSLASRCLDVINAESRKILSKGINSSGDAHVPCAKILDEYPFYSASASALGYLTRVSQ